MEISGSRVVREVLSLLYWSMLAACTVGPGTVVTCARAGAEFQLSLIYVLMFASAMAFILQVGEKRVYICMWSPIEPSSRSLPLNIYRVIYNNHSKVNDY